LLSRFTISPKGWLARIDPSAVELNAQTSEESVSANHWCDAFDWLYVIWRCFWHWVAWRWQLETMLLSELFGNLRCETAVYLLCWGLHLRCCGLSFFFWFQLHNMSYLISIRHEHSGIRFR